MKTNILFDHISQNSS